MKKEILQILRQDSERISGEYLSSILGISRVSVWKHIKSLIARGYDVETTSKGYRLLASPDTPFAWEFPDRYEKIHYLETVDSTMDIARNLARKGCPHLTVVVASTQRKGRGRLNRAWYSDKGGLYFTIVLQLSMPPQYMGRVNFYTAAILAQTLREEYGADAKVKWPNDILIDGKKLCGMLSEMEVEGEMVTFLNIGIGINVNNDPTRQEPNGVSLQRCSDRKVLKKELLAIFLDRFEEKFDLAMAGTAIDLWKKYNSTLGRYIRIVTHNDTLEGYAEDVDTNGALLLKQDGGKINKVIYGDCFH
ncbi:MAG: biotin--[acetyl-CoA-carboxylase] ligase [Desulfobulbaceae bacterium S5133MH15]|nr:MAG: biotin--[acetyl-CoA-carboxylase] ligase [Desulfobulbaceae bacterium S5133MH15]